MENAQNSESTPHAAAPDIPEILKQFNVPRRDAPDEMPMDSSTADIFLSVVEDPSQRARCVAQLFPKGVPLGGSFFDLLDELRQCIGVAETGEEAIGRVWAEAMRQLDTDEQQQLLHGFATSQRHDLFANLGSLFVVVREHVFAPGFLADWFTDLLHAVERDYMQDGFLKAVRTLCEEHTDVALEVLWALCTPPDPRRLSVAGFMLGTLRSFELDETRAAQLRKVEDFFEQHDDASFRAVFDRSWVTTARNNGITTGQMQSLFARAARSAEDLGGVLCVVSQLMSIDNLFDTLAPECPEWISRHVGPDLTSEAKHCVAAAAARLLKKGINAQQYVEMASEWIVSIQPVAEEYRGTWNRIGDFLCDLLTHDREQFVDVVERLAHRSAEIIHRLLSSRHLDRLSRDMRRAGVGELVGRLAVSADAPTRQLGLYLFERLEIDAFPKGILEDDRDFSSRILFYAAQKSVFEPTSLARILIALVPIADQSADAFRDEVFAEICLQCRNFAGACRAELESHAKDVPMVQEALEQAAQYFANLKAAHEAGINKMEVPGHRQAAALYQRHLSRQMEESVKSHSPIFGMMKQVRLPYGSASSQFFCGHLGDAIPLIHTTSSVEMPLVDLCDPEEMALRRIHASAAIQALVRQRQQKDARSMK